MVNFGRDYVPKNPDYDPLRVALVLMSNFAWWMLAWVVLWRGWIGENVEVSTGVAEGGESAQSGDVDESGDDKAEETEAVDGTKKSANGTPKAKKGKGRKDW